LAYALFLLAVGLCQIADLLLQAFQADIGMNLHGNRQGQCGKKQAVSRAVRGIRLHDGFLGVLVRLAHLYPRLVLAAGWNAARRLPRYHIGSLMMPLDILFSVNLNCIVTLLVSL
jgi:hypothetical protein